MDNLTSQLPVGTMAAGQLLIGMTTISQLLEKMMATVRLIDLMLIKMVWNTLKSHENYLCQEN